MSINAGGVSSYLDLDTSKFNSGMAAAEGKMGNFSGKLKGIGDSMGALGKKMTMGITLPLAGIAIAALNVGKNFEAGMSEVSAISGTTGDDLQKLEDRARELASSTKYSATEAADGLKYMALAGWDVDQMYTALPSVLSLATAANMDLAAATDIVTDTMGAFGLEAEEAGKTSDIFAAAQAKSNTSVTQLGEAMKYAGPAAKAANQDLAETTTILGILADSGLKGSAAGTTVTAMFRDMKKASEDGNIAIGDTSIALYDAQGNMRDMGDILGEFNVATKDMTGAQRDAALGAMFGEQSLKGMNIMLETGTERYAELEGSIRNSNGAAEEMAAIMGDNLTGKIAVLKSTLEEAGLKIAEILLPAVQKMVEKITEAVTWFSSLEKGTQETIVKFGLFAAALGPVLLIGGKLLTSFAAISTAMGALGGSAAAAGAATTTMGAATGTAGIAVKAGALLFNPWVLGAAAVAVGGVLIAKKLSEETIPAMESFGDSVSTNTQDAMNKFLALEQSATANLTSMSLTGQTVTEELKESVVGNTNQMADDVIAILEQEKADHLRVFSEKMAEVEGMTEEEFNKLYDLEAQKYDEQIIQTQTKKDRISEIYTEAMENNRGISDDEKTEILAIMEDLKDETILLVSQSKIEQERIYETLKENATRLSAEMYLEIVNNSKKQKEETIANADAEYKEKIRLATKMKEEGTAESITMANAIIREAERQKGQTITKAEEMHAKVVAEVKSQGGDVVKQLDLDNGKIKSTWDELTTWFKNNPIIRKIKTVASSIPTTGNFSVGGTQRYAQGTNFAPGGLALVGEQGRELVNLPKGSQVHTNQATERMLGSGEVNQYITINSPTALNPSEIARQTKNASRKLAMEFN